MIKVKNIVFNLIISLSIHLSSLGNIITLYSHGVIHDHTQAYWYAKEYTVNGTRYQNERYLFSWPFVTFNYADASEGFRETSFGQDNEIARLKSAYEKTIAFNSDKIDTPREIILFGLSRGASTILNFVGLHKPKTIKALVLESPFDVMASIIDNKMRQLHINWLPHSYGQFLAESIFYRYNRNGVAPINVISEIPDIPILIICSKEDKTVPFLSSVEIYKSLRALGHKHTHILIVDNGKHAKILQNTDGQLYQSVVHAFYKRYNLPYNAIIADMGEKHFSCCQPIL